VRDEAQLQRCRKQKALAQTRLRDTDALARWSIKTIIFRHMFCRAPYRSL
jgi:hypothetical protein